MKLLGFFIFLFGAILLWFTSITPAIGWALLIIGAIIVIGGYLFKSRAS
jgi:hypothetical protein